MFKLNKLNQSLLSATLILSAGYASAAAFQLAEVSTSGLGRAYAGDAAIAENASVVAINPALMTQFKRAEISVGGTYIKPDVNLSGKINSVTVVNPNTGTPVTIPSNADASHNKIAKGGLIPNLYYVQPINDQFAVGGGINVNYGLATEFDSNYSAGVFAGKTDLTTINFNLSGAYRLNQHWSFGLGLNAVYADALVERHLGVLGDVSGAPRSTVAARLEGKEWGYGWNAGVVYEFNERNRIGVAYHSHVDIDFKGDFSSQLPAPRGTGGNVIPGALTLNLPAYWEVSGYHRLTDKLAASYSYKWTRWSRFQELDAKGSDSKQLFHKNEKFKDASRIALGLSYNFSEQFTLRTGIAYDESPVQRGYHSISIPDADRTWLSLGATYRFTPDLSVDIGYSHLIAQDNTFTETESGVSATFSSKSKANIYGLSLNYRF
ncbi:outer membrane protein transport protein [Testudinibacter sp. P27/CKL/0425]